MHSFRPVFALPPCAPHPGHRPTPVTLDSWIHIALVGCHVPASAFQSTAAVHPTGTFLKGSGAIAAKKCAIARSPLRAVSRAMRFRQRTQPCRERMRGCAVDDALGHRSGRISARTRAFFGSCRGNPSQTLATKRNRPRTQREGGPEGPPSLEVRCPLKQVRAISRGAVLRAGRSA